MPRRNRKAQPRRRPPSIEHMVERLTTDQMARRLVANGKASPLILGPLGRPRGEPHQIQADSPHTDTRLPGGHP